MHATFEGLIGECAIEILAALAIGGESGVAWLKAARALGLSVVDVRRIVIGLEAGGVVTGVDENYVAVQPATLRHALVRDVFFSGPARLDFLPLIQACRNLSGVAETLVGVRTIGGEVPADLLWDVLEQACSGPAWVRFAWFGRGEATRVLNEKPQMLIQVAMPALYNIPEVIIGHFLIVLSEMRGTLIRIAIIRCARSNTGWQELAPADQPLERRAQWRHQNREILSEFKRSRIPESLQNPRIPEPSLSFPMRHPS